MPVNNTNINNTEDSVKADPVASSIEKTLLSEADLVSSAPTGIETAIEGAISGIQGSQEASAARIESDAANQARSIQRTGMLSTETSQEGRRGFATQTAVLRDILNTTNESLTQLDKQKQDLLMQGEAEAASQIAQLKVQSLTLAQEARNSAVNNMMQASTALFNRNAQVASQEQQVKDNAFATIESLNDLGTLQNADSEDLANLEKEAGLPTGTLSDIPDTPTDWEIRTVGNSLIAVDPANPTSMKVIYSKPATNGGGDVLSIKDTQDLGLPISLAGLTEETLVNSLSSDSVPSWYQNAEEAVRLQSIEPNSLRSQWDNFRGNLLKRTAVPETGGKLTLAEEFAKSQSGN